MSWETIALLRLYIDDPAGAEEVFHDIELQNTLDDSGSDVHAAAAKLWSIKAATVHKWYLSQIDGAFLSRNQVFDHCMAMSKYHEDKGAGKIETVSLDTGGGGSSTTQSVEF